MFDLMSSSNSMGANSSLLQNRPSSQSRTTSPNSPNNLPPMVFHAVHGDNIRLSRDSGVARRNDSFCKGIAFTSRPVRVNEKIYVKFADTSVNWSGALRFGFTSSDPSNLRSGLPKYACPDLTNKPGNWAKALSERCARKDTVLFYYVNEAGHVHYGLNGEEKGIFFDGVNTRTPLWGLFDIYGNTVAIELIDPRQQLNNNNNNNRDETERLAMSLSSISLDQTASDRGDPPLKVYRDTHFNQMPFHKVKGANVTLSLNRHNAERTESHYSQGYAFTSRPLRLGERLVYQVLGIESSYVGALAFGLTSCNPVTLNPAQLPDDSDLLLDRLEYWVVKKDVADSPVPGDELAFLIKRSGEVQFAKNNQTPTTIMHVDHTQTLWAFVDLYAQTTKIKCLGVTEKDVGGRMQRSHTIDSSDRGLLPDDHVDECTLCFERPINCVLYDCGHMCMCFQCAEVQFKSGGGFCPICRKTIKDILRTYRS